MPFRKIGESIGAAVNWDNKTRTITANKGTTEVILKIGSSAAYVNGAPVGLDMPPIIRNNRTLVPLRFFSEAFGASVFWQSKTRVIRIDTGQNHQNTYWVTIIHNHMRISCKIMTSFLNWL